MATVTSPTAQPSTTDLPIDVSTETFATESFNTQTTSEPVGLLLPQKMGTRLWAPMFVMALMGFAAAFVLSFVRSATIADANPADTADIETLRHLVTGFMFIGFTAVFAAISFAVARILGVFRVQGSRMQADVRSDVKTLKMPLTGKVFVASMMMGMMAMLAGAVGHIIVGASVPTAAEADLLTSERWFLFFEGLRRIGAGLYLFGITSGLVTILQVIRFQSLRVRQLVG